ncbi:MAG: efflux RND transporter periplasmic adaptor subunit [Pseudomonadota bacterium]
MLKRFTASAFSGFFIVAVFVLFVSAQASLAEDAAKDKGPPPAPVRVAEVERRVVSDQISLIGTTEAIATSMVAAEVSGVVEYFPAQEGDFVEKGKLLARLRSIDLQLRLKAADAVRKTIQANLERAKKELERVSKLKDTRSVAEKAYDDAYFTHLALSSDLMRSEADIAYLEYDIKQKQVLAPFSGFVAREHTQVGEWINAGGPVVTLVDLGEIRITVDVPEQYAVMLAPQDEAKVLVKNVSSDPFSGKIFAVLPQGNPDARTFPVRIKMPNPDLKIKSGMEAMITFNLSTTKDALLVPKDAVVTMGNNRMVYLVADGKAVPVSVTILGYYDGNVAVEGNFIPGAPVVIRGNERLRPGQPVSISE